MVKEEIKFEIHIDTMPQNFQSHDPTFYYRRNEQRTWSPSSINLF